MGEGGGDFCGVWGEVMLAAVVVAMLTMSGEARATGGVQQITHSDVQKSKRSLACSSIMMKTACLHHHVLQLPQCRLQAGCVEQDCGMGWAEATCERDLDGHTCPRWNDDVEFGARNAGLF